MSNTRVGDGGFGLDILWRVKAIPFYATSEILGVSIQDFNNAVGKAFAMPLPGAAAKMWRRPTYPGAEHVLPRRRVQGQ